MTRPAPLTALFLTGALASLAALPAGGTAPPAGDLIKDRADFLPRRKYLPLAGKAVGLLVHDGQPVLSTEGRSGPSDQLCFASGGASYRWVYVPTQGPPLITNLRVPVGTKGESQTYAALDLARPPSVTPWGITARYTLVEVEVNGDAGSPPGDSFVATSIKSVEGTDAYPLRAASVVADLRRRYAAFLKEKAPGTDAALAEAQKKALGNRKPTGPREQSDLLFVTWMPETKTLRAGFRTKISDGAYTFIQQEQRPPPGKRALPRGALAQLPFPQPPPPWQPQVKVGTTFGVEFGMAYEVSREGKLLRSQMLPYQSFQDRLVPPPGAGPRGRPAPLSREF
jgi:hypothetical protein